MKIQQIALVVGLISSSVAFASQGMKGMDLAQLGTSVHRTVKPCLDYHNVARDGWGLKKRVSVPSLCELSVVGKNTGLQAIAIGISIDKIIKTFATSRFNFVAHYMRSIDWESYFHNSIYYATDTSTMYDAAINHVLVPAMHTGITKMREWNAEAKSTVDNNEQKAASNPKNVLLDEVSNDLTSSAQLAAVAAAIKFIPSVVKAGISGIASGDVRIFGFQALVEVLHRLTGGFIYNSKHKIFGQYPVIKKAMYPLMAFVIMCGVDYLR